VSSPSWATRSPGQREADLERLRELATVTVSVSSRRDEVTVAVSSAGAVTDLRLSGLALRMRPSELGELITKTINEAADQARESSQEGFAEITGGRGFMGAVSGDIPPAPPMERLEPDGLEPGRLEPEGAGPPGAAAGPPGAGPAASPFADPLGGGVAEIEERLARMAEESRANLRRYEELQAELAELTVTADAPDRTVSVTVRYGGAVERIALGPQAIELGLPQLGTTVLSTIQSARAQAATLMVDRVQEATGPRLDIRALVDSIVPEEKPADTRESRRYEF
jgi:DNA-binding protein YbaB